MYRQLTALSLDFLAVIFCCLNPVHSIASEAVPGTSNHYVHLLYGRASSTPLNESLFKASNFEENYNYTAFGVGTFIADYKKLKFDIEAQAIRHYGVDKFNEYTIAAVMRYSDFPWNNSIFTEFAFIEGLSYASRIPRLEELNKPRATQLLNYLAFELNLSASQSSNYRFVIRMHHRSGVFGLFDDVKGASNAWSAGLSYRY